MSQCGERVTSVHGTIIYCVGDADHKGDHHGDVPFALLDGERVTICKRCGRAWKKFNTNPLAHDIQHHHGYPVEDAEDWWECPADQGFVQAVLLPSNTERKP